MSALPKKTLRSLVENRSNRDPDIIMDEIPRTYEPDFRTLPHYPEGKTRRGLPGIFDDFPGMPSGLPGRKKETYEECQSRQDPGVMHIMDPCRGLPHGGFKLPDLGADSKGYPSIPQGPSVGQELGKLAGMFLGEFIANRFGK
jgi:hypothetical protein